jgi:hypothetical protein
MRFVEALRLHGRAWRKIEGKIDDAAIDTSARKDKSHIYFMLQSTSAPRQQCRFAVMRRNSLISWRRRRRLERPLAKVCGPATYRWQSFTF